MPFSTARGLSADIVAKLSNALENFEDVTQDEVMIMLSEALDVINELVVLVDNAGDE
ncbi:hypothetical protein KX729_08465 [Rhizobium sp. XQZ8]|uniref:hypothetical protein n=1 Tax=Rhizobium populisoli TaxID=2859785 RepID=UPI001CA5015F|nr:hypothetical protein [Rhizobium populisoli]MBW6421473.1 hypothetical protein [Rhizobium populisoli]